MDALIFQIDTQRFAIDLSIIERIIRIAAVTDQPNAEEHVLGVLNLHGVIIPIIDFRSLIGFAKKETTLSDQFIICTVFNQKVGLLIDKVHGIKSPTPHQLSRAIDSLSKDDSIEWVIKDGDQVTLFYNVAKLLQSKTQLFAKAKTNV